MNLQKLQTQREGHRGFIERYLEKIEGAKEEESIVEFDAILKSIEDKVQFHDTLNDKILSQQMELKKRYFKPTSTQWK